MLCLPHPSTPQKREPFGMGLASTVSPSAAAEELAPLLDWPSFGFLEGAHGSHMARSLKSTMARFREEFVSVIFAYLNTKFTLDSLILYVNPIYFIIESIEKRYHRQSYWMFLYIVC